jgi:hypothetical protein
MNKIKVLLLGNETIRSLLYELITLRGVQVTSAANVSEALRFTGSSTHDVLHGWRVSEATDLIVTPPKAAFGAQSI